MCMSSRRSVVMIWSCYFALGCVHLALKHYWTAAIWMGLGLSWFIRGNRAARLDDLSSDSIGLKPQSRALFSSSRIFVQS